MESEDRTDLEHIRERYTGRASSEWDRLQDTPITRIEYMITRGVLERHLPKTGLILDAGSGPGRYAILLAQQGYRVVMFDLVDEMLRMGRRKIVERNVREHIVGLVEGDISSQPFPESVFDAVVSLGAPLSHLTEANARFDAVQEMVRVVRPGGRVFLTGLTRTAFYRSALYWPDWELFAQLLKPDFRASGVVQGSQLWYTFATDELEGLARSAGLHVLDRVGCEGLAAHLPLEHLEVRMEHVDETTRRLTITTNGSGYDAVLEAAERAVTRGK